MQGGVLFTAPYSLTNRLHAGVGYEARIFDERGGLRWSPGVLREACFVCPDKPEKKRETATETPKQNTTAGGGGGTQFVKDKEETKNASVG